MSSKIFEIGLAVDFGMTGSGVCSFSKQILFGSIRSVCSPGLANQRSLAVAWNTADTPWDIDVICRWSFGDTSASAPKVPTRISMDEFGNLAAWGFNCQENSPNTKELFKTFMDNATFDLTGPQRPGPTSPRNPSEVNQWCRFFLRSLFEYAILYIGEILLKGAAANCRLLVNLNLTTPTTWGASSVANFGHVAEAAFYDASQTSSVKSFGPCLKSIKTCITEPEAAAIYILNSNPTIFSLGDHILSLDIGGATSDLCLVRIAEVNGQSVCLRVKLAMPVMGISKGCAEIDRLFMLDALNRLYNAGFPLPWDTAHQMRTSHNWWILKNTYEYNGSMKSDDSKGVQIPGCHPAYNHDELGIRDGHMILSVCSITF